MTTPGGELSDLLASVDQLTSIPGPYTAPGWTYEDLVIIIPSLLRPHRVAPMMESIHNATPGAHVMWVLTPGDTAMAEAVEAHPDITDYALSPWPANGRGDYPRKINMGYRASQEPLLFLGADDLEFTPGWFEIATEPVSLTFAPGGVIEAGAVVVGTSDGHNPRTLDGRLSTHSLVTRTYARELGTADQAGAVLCEGYWHEYVDNELCETAKARGRYHHATAALVEHLHPDYGLAPNDEVYSQQRRERQRFGRRLFDRRKHLWT